MVVLGYFIALTIGCSVNTDSAIHVFSFPSAIFSMMPKFAPLLDSPTVLVDLGDGVQTPTPQRLIDLADYLKTIQG